MTEVQLEREALGWLAEIGYPPDQQDEAIELALRQAEAPCEAWI